MTISASDLRYEYSGGTGNNEPDYSMGGAISGVGIVSGSLNNIFDDVTTEEALSGSIDYRCIYFANNSSVDADDVKIWIHTETPSTDSEFSIGLDHNIRNNNASHIVEKTATVFNGYQSEYTEKNHITYNLDYTDAIWTKSNCSIVTTKLGPSNSSQAQGIVGTAANTFHGITQTPTSLSATYPYVGSWYVAPGNLSWAYSRVGATATAYFDLDNVVLGTVDATAEGAGIEGPYVNGFYRVYVYEGTAGATSVVLNLFGAPSDGSTSYTGDGATVDLYAFGAQLEQRTPVPGSLVWNDGSTARNRTEDGIVYAANDGNVDLSNGSMTFEFHVPGTEAPATQVDIINVYKTGGDDTITFSIATSGYASVAIDKDGSSIATLAGSTDLTDNKAHFVKIAWSIYSGVYLYIDGSLIDSSSISEPTPFEFDFMEITASYRAVTIRDWRFYDSLDGLLFSALDGFSGVSNLPDELTINGQPQTPHYRYKGYDATDTAWPADGYGADLTIDSAVDPHTVGVKALGTSKYSYCPQSSSGTGATNRKGYESPFQSTLDATSDFMIVVVMRSDITGTGSTMLYELASQGLSVREYTSGGYRFMAGLFGSVSLAYLLGPLSISQPGKYHVLSIFGNRDEASTDGAKLFINDVSSPGVDISGLGDLTADQDFQMMKTEGQEVEILFAATWLKSSWYAAGVYGAAQASDAHNETMWRFAGVWPTYAAGSYTLSTPGTSGTAVTQTYDYETGNQVLHFLGQGLPRVGSTRTASVLGGMTFSRPLTESAAVDITSILGGGQAQAIWIKRTITSGAAVYDNDYAVIRTKCTAD